MKRMLLVLFAACCFAACNNDSESGETKDVKAPDSSAVAKDSAAHMMDPTENPMLPVDSLNRRPHQ